MRDLRERATICAVVVVLGLAVTIDALAQGEFASAQEEEVSEANRSALDRILVAIGSIDAEIEVLQASSELEPSNVLIVRTEHTAYGSEESIAPLHEALSRHEEQIQALQSVLERHEAVTPALKSYGIRAQEVIAMHVVKGGYLMLFVTAAQTSSNTSWTEVHHENHEVEDPE